MEYEVDVGGLKKEYQAIQDDWRQKRSFCIRLIDDAVIRRGAQLRDILDIFGTDARPVMGDPRAQCTATIHFQSQMKSGSSERYARGFRGWYLRISSDESGSVENYYLSNLHK